MGVIGRVYCSALVSSVVVEVMGCQGDIPLKRTQRYSMEYELLIGLGHQERRPWWGSSINLVRLPQLDTLPTPIQPESVQRCWYPSETYYTCAENWTLSCTGGLGLDRWTAGAIFSFLAYLTLDATAGPCYDQQYRARVC